MRQAIALVGLLGAFQAGCSRENASQDSNQEKQILPQVKRRSYQNGYDKYIYHSPHGTLFGHYFKFRDSGNEKVNIEVEYNNTFTYLVDKNNDGKADRIDLTAYQYPIRENRAANPVEFNQADQIIKYWKETN